jgi:hypothetical protein
MTIRSTLLLMVLWAATAKGEQARTLELVWLDAHGLFPDFDRVRSEADPIFRDLRVAVRWEVGSDPRPFSADEVRIQIVLMPSEPAGWGISPSAMGVVLLAERARQNTAYLFYPPILRNVGLGRKAGAMLNPRERRDVARAVARVLVHEVIHTIAPNLSHADEGVMHDALLMGALSRSEIAIDDRTRNEFLRGLLE